MKLSRWILVIICLELVYWAYLIATTTPIVIYDAINYLDLGRLLLDQGWSQYFATGPHREPLFPLILSWSLGLERLTTIPYYIFCRLFLLSFLAFTMLGVYCLVCKMGARKITAALAALYLGISPALLNSTLWLWSEAAAYPWVIGVSLCSIEIYKAIQEQLKLRVVILLASALAVLFFLLTMVKALTAVMFVFYLITFVVIGFYYFLRRDKARFLRILIVLFITGGIFTLSLEGYKYINFSHSGHYEVTNRGDYALFGNTMRRLQPLTTQRITEAILSVPRLGLCEKVYGNDCVFWTYLPSDIAANEALEALKAKGASLEEKRNVLMEGSFRFIQQHPIQEFLLSSLEGTKMLFWENKTYFVKYPEGLNWLYSRPLFVIGLCFLWAALSLAGLVYGIRRAWTSDKLVNESGSAFLFTIVFIVCFTASYSLFFIDQRYALPIAPLFVALAAVFLERLICSKKT